MKRTYTLLIHQDENGRFWSSYEELDGCFSEGDTLEECVENAQEALALWLEAGAEHGDEPPEPLGAPHAAAVEVDLQAGKARVERVRFPEAPSRAAPAATNLRGR